MMARYKTGRKQVQAVLFTGTNHGEVERVTGSVTLPTAGRVLGGARVLFDGQRLCELTPGDWVVVSENGDKAVFSNAAFRMVFKRVTARVREIKVTNAKGEEWFYRNRDEAAEQLRVAPSTVTQMLANGHRTARGFTAEWVAK